MLCYILSTNIVMTWRSILELALFFNIPPCNETCPVYSLADYLSMYDCLVASDTSYPEVQIYQDWGIFVLCVL